MGLLKLFAFLNLFVVPICLGEKHDLNENCTCVPYYQCADDFGELITDGKGLLDIRILENAPCQGYFDVCCNVSQANLFPPKNVPFKHHGCGYESSGFFPWSGTLFLQTEADIPQLYRCGVSLIHPSAVLTAAHCMNGNGNWTVHLGGVTRQVSKVIIHPSYNNETMENDIALLILNKSIEDITTICIPPSGTNLDNEGCEMTSRINFPDYESSYPFKFQVTIVSRVKCLNMLRSTRLGPFFRLHASFLCAVSESSDSTCTGDGGNALLCSVPSQPGSKVNIQQTIGIRAFPILVETRCFLQQPCIPETNGFSLMGTSFVYHQAGILSWGIGCKKELPDVYTKVSIFRDWIDTEMKKNGFDIISYRY